MELTWAERAESTRDARVLDSWLPLLLTTSCTRFRMKSFLPAGEAEGQDPVALFSLSSVIITHLAPKQRGYVFLVLLPPITKKPFHCLRMLHRTRLVWVLESLWLLQVELRMTPIYIHTLPAALVPAPHPISLISILALFFCY